MCIALHGLDAIRNNIYLFIFIRLYKQVTVMSISNIYSYSNFPTATLSSQYMDSKVFNELNRRMNKVNE